ncbi:uncharacterized protein LOC123526196 isoform X2 [Mercenaria mercenaria]|uniref:uncharacterized protein LOC123526196 isoform X2 n=1 Tax=Mercenaria mercenaria TaxID=6596 RepID=UPI00234F1208|nr:uncharacterized protein LOC123526196 isoform X2 [Mercenaria mercenaria]
MNRKSRSITRRSSDDDTGIVGGRNRRSSRRVSFAEMCQIKEFQKDSPKVYKDIHSDEDSDGKHAESSAQSKSQGITGLDKLLTGAIQTPYQDVAEYPIPEMSSESFNLFDINKTVLETVDMDTTQAGGNIDTFFPPMDFQNEPSMELKFDTMSFLQSLQGKPSDRLKTMQIYSPKRDRYIQEQSSPDGPSLPINFNNMDHDKENMIPMEALPSFTNSNQEPEALKYVKKNKEPQASVDSRMFLQSLFGGNSKNTEETKHDIEEMEETACIDGIVTQVDKGDMNRNSGAFSVGRNDDVTRYFNTEDVTVGIEETKCVGGIVNEVMGVSHSDEADKENSVHLANRTVHMEETRPVGGILKGGGLNTTVQTGLRMQQGYNSGINAEDNVTRCFKMEEDADDGIEETKCVGGILSKAGKNVENSIVESQIGRTSLGRAPSNKLSADKTRISVEDKEIRTPSPMEVTAQGVASINNFTPEATINFNVSNMQDNMEETKAIGGIINKTVSVMRNEQITESDGKYRMDTGNQTVTMEETVALGKILDTSKNGLDQSVNKSIVESQQLVDSTTVMEETKPVGGILKINQSIHEKFNLSRQQEEKMEVTKNITVPMEETKAIGGFLEKSKVETLLTPCADEAVSNKTLNVSVAMEETKALGGLLDKTVPKAVVENSSDNDFVDKTVDYTVAMDETKSVGRILERTNIGQIPSNSKDDSCSNKTLNQTVPVEETKSVRGILNKTADRTMCFDEVKTDWLSEDLKSDSSGKAADGTAVQEHNKTVGIEETKCVGGILSSDMEMMKGKFENMYNHANDDDTGNKTVIEPVIMEETRCVTNVVNKDTSELNTGAKVKSDKNYKLQSQIKISDKEESKSEVCMESDFNVKNKEIEGENKTCSDKDVESNSNDVEIDDEITFKVSNKRNFDECKGEILDKNEEKTKDFTQSNLAKLKEMLILSKRKTAAHLRQGDIRTPSKFSPLFPGSAPESSSKASCSSKLDLGVTRSPVHKRQRLSEVDVGVSGETDDDFDGNEKTDATAALLMGFEDDGFTTGLLENSKIEATDIQGIDDEQMPDTLHHDFCVSNSSNETRSDKNSTVHSEPVSTTVQESNETHSSGNDTRNNSSVNLSMFSNKSFALSFVVPEGPLSLESFFKLTFTLSSKIQGARCSTIFVPRIDVDDLTEVLHAELTLNPIVQAKKRLKANITQQIEKSEANMAWLEKSLEETQPEIFQECAKASSDELQKITGQLRSLLLACHKEVEIAWKERTKEMFTEALHDIQENGVTRAEEMLHKVQSDSQSLDDLLISLDDDLESLERNDQLLEELQSREEKLNSEMEKLTVALREKSTEEHELLTQIQCQSQKETTDEVKNQLMQEILAHLICCEWNLDEFEEDFVVFTFLDDKVELHVDFLLGAKEKQISNISLRLLKSSADNVFFEDKVAFAFILEGINTDSLKQRFTTFSSLPKLLHEVSVSINEIRMFCKDLEEVHTYNVLKFENNSIHIELWDRDTMDFIKTSFKFNPSHPLTSHVETSVTVRFGKLKSCYIEDKLRDITPGPRYLSRLIQSVNFNQFKNDTSMES